MDFEKNDQPEDTSSEQLYAFNVTADVERKLMDVKERVEQSYGVEVTVDDLLSHMIDEVVEQNFTPEQQVEFQKMVEHEKQMMTNLEDLNDSE